MEGHVELGTIFKCGTRQQITESSGLNKNPTGKKYMGRQRLRWQDVKLLSVGWNEAELQNP
jgi:hypothetical protein